METTPTTTPYTDYLAARADAARARVARMGRDRLGRFVRRTNIDAIETFHADADNVDHANTTCANIVGTTTPGTHTGWACTACISVDMGRVAMAYALADVAPTTGTQTCDTCDHELPVTKFPTIVIAGFRGRAISCRSCESAARTNGVPFDNFATTYARIVWDTTTTSVSGVPVADIPRTSIRTARAA